MDFTPVKISNRLNQKEVSLMYIPGTIRQETLMPMDSVHNYFERLVFNEVKDNYADKFTDSNALADMACIALNRIPPRYIRYDIDMSFYMSVKEHIEVEKRSKRPLKRLTKKLSVLKVIKKNEYKTGFIDIYRFRSFSKLIYISIR